MTDAVLNGAERRTVAALAAIYSTRMLGLFLLLPVLALYGSALPDATPALVGLAMGIYGLTQAVLQVPFGMWSDRYGRKPIIVVGLVIFAVGSLVGVYAQSIHELILARSIQGAGAISAAVTALVADHTRENVRTRAMAFIGIAIGGSFVVSLIAAPILQVSIGVPGIFLVIAGLCLLALLLLTTLVPADLEDFTPSAVTFRKFLRACAHRKARVHYIGVFVLHFVLTAVFLVVPMLLANQLDWPADSHWKIYLIVFLLSLCGTIPMILRAERGTTRLLSTAIILAAGSQMLLAAAPDRRAFVLTGLTLFFATFNFLEARIPALLTLAVGPQERGTALGVFATSQFFGAFCGGWFGGLMLQWVGPAAVFWMSATACLIWGGLTRNKLRDSR